MPLETVTAVFLIAVPAAFVAVFVLLGREFGYPEILRQPADAILTRYRAGGKRLRLLWYAFTMVAVGFLPIVGMVHVLLSPSGFSSLLVATMFGLFAGAAQIMGFLRWAFLVPYLADTYGEPSASASTREAVLVVFEGAHRFLGRGLGEHLGYLFTGLWTLLVVPALASSAVFDPWVAWFGFLPGILILAGLFEPIGWRMAGPANALGYSLWAIWLMAMGVLLLLCGAGPGTLSRSKGEKSGPKRSACILVPRIRTGVTPGSGTRAASP
jgi:hypothetical protein